MTSPSLEHTYGDHCGACGRGGWSPGPSGRYERVLVPCRSQPIVSGPRYKDLCPHPQDALVESTRETCDPGFVTICTACGQSFPGQAKVDLLVA